MRLALAYLVVLLTATAYFGTLVYIVGPAVPAAIAGVLVATFLLSWAISTIVEEKL